MKMASPFLSCLLAFLPPSVHAVEFPQVPDPDLQAMVDRFAAEYSGIVEGNLREKPPAKEWPCVGDALKAIYQFSVDIDESVAKRAYREQIRAARAQGEDPSGWVITSSIAVDEVVPVRGQCKDGKLDGEVEVWTHSAGGIAQAGTTANSTTIMRTTQQYAAGEPVGISRSLSWTESSQVNVDFSRSGMDPKMVRKLEKAYKKNASRIARYARPELPMISYSGSGEVGRSASARFSLHPSPNRGDLVLASHLCTATRNEVKVCWQYSDGEMTSKSSYKNNLKHGEQITFARTIASMGRSVVMPETRQCFIDGVETLTTDCRVD
ncbi:MAG: hypothetical protein ACLGHJ_09890 [Gammaproteobacteria bacterium]